MSLFKIYSQWMEILIYLFKLPLFQIWFELFIFFNKFGSFDLFIFYFSVHGHFHEHIHVFDHSHEHSYSNVHVEPASSFSNKQASESRHSHEHIHSNVHVEPASSFSNKQVSESSESSHHHVHEHPEQAQVFLNVEQGSAPNPTPSSLNKDAQAKNHDRINSTPPLNVSGKTKQGNNENPVNIPTNQPSLLKDNLKKPDHKPDAVTSGEFQVAFVHKWFLKFIFVGLLYFTFSFFRDRKSRLRMRLTDFCAKKALVILLIILKN